jgi:hypothetical protein
VTLRTTGGQEWLLTILRSLFCKIMELDNDGDRSVRQLDEVSQSWAPFSFDESVGVGVAVAVEVNGPSSTLGAFMSNRQIGQVDCCEK